MSNISKITIPSGESYDLKDKDAVAGVVRQGDTVTVLKRDGNSSSFKATRVVVSDTQPTGGQTGDVWFRLVDE